MPTLVIRHLYCHKTSEGSGKDQLAFRIERGHGWEEVWKGKMSSRSGHRDLNFTYSFGSRLSLAIVERDAGDDDILGQIQFDNSNVGTGEHDYTFNGHKSHYDLTWRVDG